MNLADFTVITFEWKTILALQLMAILFVIALLHFYWAFGGKHGFLKSIPSKEDGTLLFIPNSFHCVLVGLGLFLVVVFIYLWTSRFNSPNWIFKYGFMILGGIFGLRAIGDFNYVGFFKKVRKTSFGKLDSKYYSPMCLLIAVTFFWLASTIQF